MKVSVSEVYTSVACNRMPEIVDWNEDGIICYGATNAVVIYDTNLKGGNALTVLCHHKSRVNCVKWLHKPDGTCTELISSSADKTAAIWTRVDGVWKVTSTLTGHKDGVMSLHGLYTNDDDLVVFTGSIDSTIRVWERINGTTNHKQTISLQSGLCFTLHVHQLPNSKPMLFCALDDHKIHVFAGDEYHRVHTLVGHEDWVRGLDVVNVDATTIMLASASQDTYIRLWRIQVHEDQPTSGIKVEQKVFPAYGQEWSVKLEAVLAGHEGWVYGVQWHPCAVDKDGNKKPVYRLLSSSLDKTVIIWEPEDTLEHQDQEGVWVERVRVGEVGGNGLGFYGSRFGPKGGAFMAHGYNGSFHIWQYNKETHQWTPRVVCGGHFGRVEDVAWAPQASYLASVSADQTTRLHAPWKLPDGSVEWHELARPQVHGYDMAGVAPLSARAFASAAEEKVVRVFAAPGNFAGNYRTIVKEELGGEGDGAEGASVPSLGLSNKAVFADDEDNDGYFVPVNLTEPPTEETLMQQTLWPEQQKLYGHGYEVFALAAAPGAALLASACRAAAADHAAVLIWETKTWQQIQKLVSHQLTVTQLSFSPDSRHLLSVSRDRRWTLYSRQQGSDLLEQVASTDKTNGVHTRIIWCCAWAHDSSLFATGSREGKVCVWSPGPHSGSSLGCYGLRGAPLELPRDAVTALALAPAARVAAVGLESGRIRFYAFGDGWTLLKELDNSAAHHLTVRKLSFKPKDDRDPSMLLASGGGDHLVRVYSVCIS